MQVHFNNTMITTVNLTNLNSSVVDISLIAEEREDGFDLSNLNFTWQAVSFVNVVDTGVLSIKLNFSQPLSISTEYSQDTIQFKVLPQQENWFLSSLLHKPVDRNYRILGYSIPPQVPDNAASAAAAASS